MEKTGMLTCQDLSTIIMKTLESNPSALDPCLYVRPSYYDLGLQAAKDKEPGFEMRKKKLYFRGMRVIKFKLNLNHISSNES